MTKEQNGVSAGRLIERTEQEDSGSNFLSEDEGYRYSSGLQGGEELPELRTEIASDLALKLTERVADVPKELVWDLSFKLAARALELMSGEAPVSLQQWREEHPRHATIADTVFLTVMNQMDKVAIPRSLNPDRYVKELKRKGPFAKLFGKKLKPEKQAELELEVYQLVVSAVERYESLKQQSDALEEGLKARQEKVDAEIKKQKASAQQETKTLLDDARNQERILDRRVKKLELRMAQLRAEAAEDPGLTKALAKMETLEEDQIKEKLVETAKFFSKRIQDMHIGAQVNMSWNQMDLHAEKVENCRQEVIALLQVFLETMHALQDLAVNFGVEARKRIAKEIYGNITVFKSLAVWQNQNFSWNFFDTNQLIKLASLLYLDETSFQHCIKKANQLIPKLNNKIQGWSFNHYDNADGLDDLMNLADRLQE